MVAMTTCGVVLEEKEKVPNWYTEEVREKQSELLGFPDSGKPMYDEE
jgi:hypothetical protein